MANPHPKPLDTRTPLHGAPTIDGVPPLIEPALADLRKAKSEAAVIGIMNRTPAHLHVEVAVAVANRQTYRRETKRAVLGFIGFKRLSEGLGRQRAGNLIETAG